MWLQLGIASGVIMAALALFKRTRRRRPREIDVGPVSEAWLAEHRARGRETSY